MPKSRSGLPTSSYSTSSHHPTRQDNLDHPELSPTPLRSTGAKYLPLSPPQPLASFYHTHEPDGILRVCNSSAQRDPTFNRLRTTLRSSPESSDLRVPILEIGAIRHGDPGSVSKREGAVKSWAAGQRNGPHDVLVGGLR